MLKMCHLIANVHGYSPFGSLGWLGSGFLKHPIINMIIEKLGKTSEQAVALR